MRPIWKGAISFGLVNIPISLYPAEEHNELKFHLIDSRDDNKIKYKRVNEVTGEEVPWETIVRAYEFEDGEYVVMTDRDFERADLSATKTVDIENFIRQDELPLVYLVVYLDRNLLMRKETRFPQGESGQRLNGKKTG